MRNILFATDTPLAIPQLAGFRQISVEGSFYHVSRLQPHLHGTSLTVLCGVDAAAVQAEAVVGEALTLES